MRIALYTPGDDPDPATAWDGPALVHLLARALGISPQATMAIGDNLNDLDLVTAAGVGVAMGDGDPRVRAAADWVTGTYADDGAALAIERFVLGEEGAP